MEAIIAKLGSLHLELREYADKSSNHEVGELADAIARESNYGTHIGIVQLLMRLATNVDLHDEIIQTANEIADGLRGGHNAEEVWLTFAGAKDEILDQELEFDPSLRHALLEAQASALGAGAEAFDREEVFVDEEFSNLANAAVECAGEADEAAHTALAALDNQTESLDEIADNLAAGQRSLAEAYKARAKLDRRLEAIAETEEDYDASTDEGTTEDEFDGVEAMFLDAVTAYYDAKSECEEYLTAFSAMHSTPSDENDMDELINELTGGTGASEGQTPVTLASIAEDAARVAAMCAGSHTEKAFDFDEAWEIIEGMIDTYEAFMAEEPPGFAECMHKVLIVREMTGLVSTSDDDLPPCVLDPDEDDVVGPSWELYMESYESRTEALQSLPARIIEIDEYIEAMVEDYPDKFPEGADTVRAEVAEFEALDEIYVEQNNTGQMFPAVEFELLVREIAQDYMDEAGWEPDAIRALQEAAEAHMVARYQDSNLVAIHAHRTHIHPRDLHLARRISDPGRF